MTGKQRILPKREPRGQDFSGKTPSPDEREPCSLRRVRAFLLVMVTLILVARPLFPSEGADLGDDVTPTMLVFGTVLIGIVFSLGRSVWRVKLQSVDLALLGTVVWLALAALRAVHSGTARPAINMLWVWVGYYVLWQLIRQLNLTDRERRAILAGMAALSVGVASYGLYQYFVELPHLRAGYQTRRTELLHELGWDDLLEDPVGLAQFENRLFSREPLATFALTNSLAGFLLPWSLVFLAAIVGNVKSLFDTSIETPSLLSPSRPHNTRQDGRLCKPTRRLAWAALGVSILGMVGLLCCLVLTKSRSAYIALACGLAVLLATGISLRGKVARRMVIVIMVLLALAFGVATATRGLDWQVLSEATKSLGYRWQYWQATTSMIADHPLLGCGPGNFRYAYTRYKLPEASEEISDPHNFLLEVVATGGIPAGAFFLLAIGLTLWHLKHSRSAWGLSSSAGSPPSSTVPLAGVSGKTVFHSRDQLWAIAMGWVLAWPAGYWLGLLSSAPQDLTFLLVGLPTAALVGLGLWPWIQAGPLVPGIVAAAIAAISINWLAAGGLTFPGVAGSFWLLWVLATDFPTDYSGKQPPTENQPSTRWSHRLQQLTAPEGFSVTLPTWAGLAILVFFGLVLAAFYITAYSPVLQARGLLSQATVARRFSIDRAKQFCRLAAEADPWAFEPWMRLVELWQAEGPTPPAKTGESFHSKPEVADLTTFLQKANRPSPQERAKELDSYAAALLQRAPNHHAASWILALAYQQLFRETNDRRALARAVSFARRAIELYPHQARYHAGLAELLRTIGDPDGAKKAAKTALWLHTITPHADRKLPDETVQFLEKLSQTP
ncbi:O-antigen ligase family protein [Thermogutta sp.]|uniref:O-antigen ligase family protein n=1 Tax=Thermogutta sp. TaxID=1962930 RepID=UPI00321F9810